jgi:hypothetical protein
MIDDGNENFESEMIYEDDISEKYNDIPLSKHIPKEILKSASYGASKNLLG